MDGLILEPLKYYNSYAKEKHKSNAQEHFDSLAARSGVDVEANRKTVKELNLELAAIDKLKKEISKNKALFVFLVVLSVIGGLMMFLGVFCLVSEYATAGVIILLLGIAFLITGILVITLVIRPRIKNAEKILDTHHKKAEELYNVAMGQMAPLNLLFDDKDTFALIEKTMPEIKFNPHLSPEHRELMIKDFGYIDPSDETTSVVDSISGKMLGNPFVYERIRTCVMGTYTYTGTLTIHWTERYRDSKGNYRTRTRSQVLRASLVKPKPYYYVNTQLGYGSLAAPDLSFSRKGTHVEDLSEKQLERKIEAGEKKLRKKAQKALSKGGNFQEMANTEFDVLFGATDRTNEVQFRLMYTPLAQTNTTDLLTTEDGYGDDFDFIKRGKYNVIKSEHAQHFKMRVKAAYFRSHSYDEARSKFISFNEEYFKSVFFDFAPLMAVPAYQEEPVESMKEPRDYETNYSAFEHEILANSIDGRLLIHPKSATEAIIKTSLIEKSGEVDRLSVTAHSYSATERLDYVAVYGNDGRYHNVPVHWIEYNPISRTSEMVIKALNHSEREFGEKLGADPMPENSAYVHGLMAYAISGDSKKINDLFNKYI